MGGVVSRRDHTHSMEQVCHTPSMLYEEAVSVGGGDGREAERETGETDRLIHRLLLTILQEKLNERRNNALQCCNE